MTIQFPSRRSGGASGRHGYSAAPHIFPFINKTVPLFTGQWGFKQKGMTQDAYRRMLDEKAEPVYEVLKNRAIEERLVEPKVVYGYYPVQSDQNDLIVYDAAAFEAGKHIERLRFSFPRQSGRRKLCIADFFRSRASNQFDVLGIQLVTVGDRATEAAEKLRAADKYQDYLFLHGLGVETAEALAEFWHKRMRQELGFGSEDATNIDDLFHQGYRGSRYSFGYPACPNLEDRAKIVELLNPGEIGVILSENFMLVPEQSTDALVVHHPQAKYFGCVIRVHGATKQGPEIRALLHAFSRVACDARYSDGPEIPDS